MVFFGTFIAAVKQFADVCLVVLEHIVHQRRDEGKADTRVNRAFDLLIKLVCLKFDDNFRDSAFQI